MRAPTPTATTTRIPAATTTITARRAATGTTLTLTTPFFSLSISAALSIDSMVGAIGSARAAGSTEVGGSGDLAEALVLAGLAIPGAGAVSADVEQAPSSSALEDQDVRASRAAASALAPKELADALAAPADSDQVPHAAVFLPGLGDLGEESAVMVDSVILVFQAVLTLVAASAAAHA